MSGGSYLGGLIGVAYGPGQVEFCSSSGNLMGTGSNIGGLIGYGYNSSNSQGISVDQCYSNCNVIGDTHIGGLIGLSRLGKHIYNSYSSGQVSGNRYVGGMVGYVGDGGIYNAYSTTLVSCEGYGYGGLVGTKIGGSIYNSYFLETSGPDNGEGTSLNDPNMMVKGSYEYWDFNNIWAICEGTNYPRLIWQIPLGDFLCPNGVAFNDFSYMAQAWLKESEEVDLTNDGVLNMEDLMLFCENWLTN